VFNNLGHLFTYKTGPQNVYQKCFKHDIICIIDDHNLIHNINNYSITINSSDLDHRFAVNKMATNLWCYFTLRMRDHPWHVSIRLANIFSILSSINIYPLLNTVLKNNRCEKLAKLFSFSILMGIHCGMVDTHKERTISKTYIFVLATL